MTFTKCEFIELVLPTATSGTNGVRVPFGSQSILANKLVKKIVLCTRAGGSARSPQGNLLNTDGNAENMWLTLQTAYDTQSGSNNQGNNINVLQLSQLLPIRSHWQTFGSPAVTYVQYTRQCVPEWVGVFVNWEKSYLLVNYQPDEFGEIPSGRSVVLAVYYEDMYNSKGIPLQQPLAAEQAKNMQLQQQLQYLKGLVAKAGINVPEQPNRYFKG